MNIKTSRICLVDHLHMVHVVGIFVDFVYCMDPLTCIADDFLLEISPRCSVCQPLEFCPHSYFVDFTSHALFYIMTSLPAFIKVGKTPATQNPVLEQYAVKIDNSTLFLYDKILIYHDSDFKKK